VDRPTKGPRPQIPVVKHDTVIDDLLAAERIILLREHAELENALVRGARSGRLARVLPGVYADAAAATEPITRIAAVSRWDPDAVICGRAAASLTYWDEIAVGTIQVASPARHQQQTGYEFTRRRIPPELIQELGQIAVTVPSLTAVELATLEFTDPIDLALRQRQATLDSLKAALRATPFRSGNRDRWSVLLDSRAEPWSRAERLAHRLYREAGIRGWVTNRRTVIPDWATYYLDIAFEQQQVASEIDGLIHERDAGLFESDRLRQNALVLNGWLILRFTWGMLTEDPDYVVRTTRQALATADGFVPRAGCRGRDTPRRTA
jgi:very-short-patch-repair endonuclease